MTVVLTLVQTKEIGINIHKRNNTIHSKYKYTYYQNTHTDVKILTHYKTHTYTRLYYPMLFYIIYIYIYITFYIPIYYIDQEM